MVITQTRELGWEAGQAGREALGTGRMRRQCRGERQSRGGVPHEDREGSLVSFSLYLRLSFPCNGRNQRGGVDMLSLCRVFWGV